MKLLPLLLIAVVVVTIVAEERSYRQRPSSKRPPLRPIKPKRRPPTVITRKSRELCKQSILSQLNPTKSCKKGCLITCAKKSANTVGRCEVCRDKCCEANCRGWDCIPVSQITDAITSVLKAYERLKPNPSTQAEDSTEAPSAIEEETTVEETTAEGVENRE